MQCSHKSLKKIGKKGHEKGSYQGHFISKAVAIGLESPWRNEHYPLLLKVTRKVLVHTFILLHSCTTLYTYFYLLWKWISRMLYLYKLENCEINCSFSCGQQTGRRASSWRWGQTRSPAGVSASPAAATSQEKRQGMSSNLLKTYHVHISGK